MEDRLKEKKYFKTSIALLVILKARGDVIREDIYQSLFVSNGFITMYLMDLEAIEQTDGNHGKVRRRRGCPKIDGSLC